MTKNMMRTSKVAVRGAVLVELILVMPLMILLPLATFELTRLMRISQVISTVSQEQALMAYRMCGDFLEFAQVGSELEYDETTTLLQTANCMSSAYGDAIVNQASGSGSGLMYALAVPMADPLSAVSMVPPLPGQIAKAASVYRFTPQTESESERFEKILSAASDANFGSGTVFFSSSLVSQAGPSSAEADKFSYYSPSGGEPAVINDNSSATVVDSASIRGDCNDELIPNGTYYDAGAPARPDRKRTVCGGRQRVIVSEVGYTYQPVTATGNQMGFGYTIIGLFLGNLDYREVTIL